MMKKIIFLSLLLVACTLTAISQEVTGHWNGLLSVQGLKLRLVFHVVKTDNTYSATMDSPDQGAKDIPMTAVRFDGKTLVVEHSAAKIVFTGALTDDGKLTGEFVQAGMRFPMELTREALAKPEALRRPQEPKPPYPYAEENIKFKNEKAGITLAGTLTKPNGKGPFTAVVLVTGSGPQNRDEELLGHKPFKVLADYLTRNGVAVLRFDDRGCFESGGDFKSATSFDFATDAQAALDYLRTRSDINPAKIGIIGHSEGGIIAPIVATNTNKVAFIVLMAGPGISGREILLRQQELIGHANGVDPEQVKITKEVNTKVFDMVDKITNPDTLKVKIRDYLIDVSGKTPGMNIPAGQSLTEVVDVQIAQILNPWMLNFLRYDPAPTLTKVKCPVLAIIGSKDLQVPAEVNLKAIEQALVKGKNKHFVVKELPAMNHLFQDCQTGSPNEYAVIEQTISPSVLDLIATWIKKI
ncbi:MAG: hypothetical protein H6Q20_1757 [Bacteroidetes bacterium]|nr:hypothetical protein [Bacteroidota bacterium]